MAGAPGLEPGNGGIKIQVVRVLISTHSEKMWKFDLNLFKRLRIYRNARIDVRASQYEAPLRLIKLHANSADSRCVRCILSHGNIENPPSKDNGCSVIGNLNDSIKYIRALSVYGAHTLCWTRAAAHGGNCRSGFAAGVS
jgi:hypothetical protein